MRFVEVSSGLPLERCAQLPAVVVDVGRRSGPIGPDWFTDRTVGGAAVLLRTGWDVHWGTDRYGDQAHPYLTEAAARALADAGATLVGIDSVNVDATDGDQRPAHTVLLAEGIPVVEHLTNLDQLPASGATFTAVPSAVRGLATFPVRAFAAVP